MEPSPLDAVFLRQADGEIDMIKDVPPPTEAEEYRNMAEILREFAAQVRFGTTRSALVSLAIDLDGRAAVAERQIRRTLDRSLAPAVSEVPSLNSEGRRLSPFCAASTAEP
jgi:SpoVK/Ycf46/Vps4 family AAA+-type ATPase